MELYRVNNVFGRKRIGNVSFAEEGQINGKKIYASPEKSFRVYIGYSVKESGGNTVKNELVFINKTQNITETIQNTYGNLITNEAIESSLNTVLKMLGLKVLPFWFYRKIWEKAESNSFNLNLGLVAKNSAIYDVIYPARELLALSLPRRLMSSMGNSGDSSFINWFLKSKVLIMPDESVITSNLLEELLKKITGKIYKLLYIRIGNLYYFKNFFIENVAINWDMTSLDVNGLPLRADINLNICNKVLWAQDDIEYLNPKVEEVDGVNEDGEPGKIQKVIIGRDNPEVVNSIDLDNIFKEIFQLFNEFSVRNGEKSVKK